MTAETSSHFKPFYYSINPEANGPGNETDCKSYRYPQHKYADQRHQKITHALHLRERMSQRINPATTPIAMSRTQTQQISIVAMSIPDTRSVTSINSTESNTSSGTCVSNSKPRFQSISRFCRLCATLATPPAYLLAGFSSIILMDALPRKSTSTNLSTGLPSAPTFISNVPL